MKMAYFRKFMISFLVAVLLTVAGYFVSLDNLPLVEIESDAVPLVFASAKMKVIDGHKKGAAPISSPEYVRIGDKEFAVLAPWLGHRISEEAYPRDFARLPLEFTLEGRAIYVTAATRDAFVKMATAARLDNVELMVDSGYRSVAYQRQIYQRKMAEGQDFYDIARGVAPPGYSEHMLGTTVDLVPSKWTFSGTDADKWLRENGAAFAFVQSYPQKSESGFTWEPWHWKFVGGS